jgi:eukaryotic-like serine/threonine-protein kinase
MSDTPPIGSLIAGKYRVLRELGSGGMGSLVEAEHPVLKRTVAIKLVRGRSSPQAFRRLIREAEAAQALHSEHVVRVYDVGYHDDAPYIVMERLEGSDLASMLDDGPFEIEEAVDSVLEACVGLAEAHALGIVHRDIKPANLFLTKSAQKRLVKVLDFGISKQLAVESDEADPGSTAPNQMLGSPYFMSPEQLRNPRKVDARSDVWSLGVTLYNLLTTSHPFEGPTVSEVTAAVFTDEPRSIREHRDDLPDGLCDAISAALQKRADLRTPSVKAFADGLVPFAGKRGRLAAERVSTLSDGTTNDVPVPRRPSRAQEVTATDAGLSATLPAESTDLPSSSARVTPHQTRAKRGWKWPAVVAVGTLSTLAFWVLRPVSGTPVAGSSSTLPKSESRAEAAPAAAPKLAVVASAREEEKPAAPPTQKPKPPRSQAPLSRPAASTSASSVPVAPPPPRVDIDGVPIVE